MHRILILILATGLLSAQPPTRIVSGKRYPRLVIRNAIIIEGNGTPASGPKHIVVENGMITAIVPLDLVSALSR